MPSTLNIEPLRVMHRDLRHCMPFIECSRVCVYVNVKILPLHFIRILLTFDLLPLTYVPEAATTTSRSKSCICRK